MFHSAGQGPLLHYHASEHRCEWLTPTTIPLGFMELPEAREGRTLELAPGKHTLQLVLGDRNHIPHDPPVVSERIEITVE